jgi:hypothetical protein
MLTSLKTQPQPTNQIKGPTTPFSQRTDTINKPEAVAAQGVGVEAQLPVPHTETEQVEKV